MKTDKKSNLSEENSKEKIVFCTECESDLDFAGFEEPDIKELEARHQKCKSTGKFKGEQCAMLFIAKDNDLLKDSDES